LLLWYDNLLLGVPYKRATSHYLSIYLSQMHLSCRILVLQSLLVLPCALWQSLMVCYQVGLTRLAYSMLHTHNPIWAQSRQSELIASIRFPCRRQLRLGLAWAYCCRISLFGTLETLMLVKYSVLTIALEKVHSSVNCERNIWSFFCVREGACLVSGLGRVWDFSRSRQGTWNKKAT